jgi:hypothetical protein
VAAGGIPVACQAASTDTARPTGACDRARTAIATVATGRVAVLGERLSTGTATAGISEQTGIPTEAARTPTGVLGDRSGCPAFTPGTTVSPELSAVAAIATVSTLGWPTGARRSPTRTPVAAGSRQRRCTPVSTVACLCGARTQVDALAAGAPASAVTEDCATAVAAVSADNGVGGDFGQVATLAAGAAIAEQARLTAVTASLAGQSVATAAAVAEQQATVTAVLTGAAVGAVAHQQATVLTRLHTVADQPATRADDRAYARCQGHHPGGRRVNFVVRQGPCVTSGGQCSRCRSKANISLHGLRCRQDGGVSGERPGSHSEGHRERSDTSDASGHASTMRAGVSTKVKRS